jgi:hypothetical protein
MDARIDEKDSRTEFPLTLGQLARSSLTHKYVGWYVSYSPESLLKLADDINAAFGHLRTKN